MLGLLPVWVIAAYAVSYLIIVALLEILKLAGMPVSSFLRPSIIQAVVATLMYTLTIAIIVVVPYLLRGRFSTNLKTLGLDRLMSWTDIGLSPVFYVVYMVTLAIVMVMVESFFPFLPLDQVQDIGFTAFGSSTDNIVAFVTLVVFAPVAEEVLFRGYLYGKLKVYVPAVVAALVTSFLFGVAHLQLNVGIDVFILSLFLCALRSLTGSIWAGILVHMIKNGVAYFILFVLPFIGG
ncbi:CPBP family intramembrane metalloprotease [Candidatus Saccharibacteria bacterium]|nr:CPBP family intramembrane metalloprotease [Candidatus Saccharibacteria bacterium]